MNSLTSQPTSAQPVDPDLAEQAVPGHGVPSQDPTPAAQVGLTPEETERESKSALIGGGVVAGSAGCAAGELTNPEGTVDADVAPTGTDATKDRSLPR